ncbi:hypothetical protein BGX31_009165 [Mortierella sp. GBA43]|nr:hypothetical protein BGX31_009165 [Mortierella sp. GBA43]
MVFGNGNIISSPRTLSLLQVIQVASTYLDNARNATDPTVALVFCHDTETSLSQLKKVAKNADDRDTREDIAAIYIGLGKVLDTHGHQEDAQAFYKKSEKWGHNVVSPPKLRVVIGLPRSIFPSNIRPPTIEFEPPEPDTRLISTSQLASCLGLLRASCDPEDIIVPSARTWLLATQSEPEEQERLRILATDVIRAFKRDEIKDAKAVTEVMYLAPVLGNDDFRHLLKEFYSGIDQSGLLDVHQLGGLSQLIQGADSKCLEADDLVKVLELISKRLQDTHTQSPQHLYLLTLAVSNVLDAMADADVKGLDREKTHEPLKAYLDGLKGSSDPYLVYQAAYAYQALICVPDNESPWQATLRRTGKIVKGVSGLISAVKGFDLTGFVEGLGNIQEGLSGVTEVYHLAKDAYEEVSSLAESGKTFLKCMKEGMAFSRKCAWYTALRGADTLVQEGQLAELRKLICEAPCRREMAFQWGVCQRLGEIAANASWDQETRKGAIVFLGEIYRDDSQWGQHPSVKQWILNILMQLSSKSGDAGTLLDELGSTGPATKQALYRSSRENGPSTHPLKVGMPPVGSPSLIDRVQERPDVEGQLRQLRRQRMREHGSAVYISPQAKSNVQADDEDCFPLMERMEDFMKGEQTVFLLLGDSGSGKSTFNRELEYQLWQKYKKAGTIPLHISLPAIDKPEHDMVAKQLRKAEFTEPQIRELKQNRSFVLVCDGYDESKQTRNLFTSNRLNQPGEWNVKMVISCRSEYVGLDYRDRFQPGDRNQRSDSSLFQEAVITPFSLNQIEEYIDQYVFLHRPLWEASDYKKALNLIPSLKELVKNPFLMSLSLDVLPRMVDPGQDLSTTLITRVSLYDQFMEQWLERGKKRLGEKKLSSGARAAYENLIDEGFTRNSMTFLKNLSAAIYKEQDGQPIVSYSRYNDQSSWKTEFFSREDEKQLLREACPLIRGGHQYRFIHKTLLEYGVALAVYDPQEVKEKMASKPIVRVRRGSTSSVFSFVGRDPLETLGTEVEQGPIPDSPLVWRSFVNDPSVIHFLEERVPQEPLLKKQLLDYIEHSKTDVKWRIAAANAITILVRVGMQFNFTDLRGIKIPGADISCGVFDSAQFQGADLRQVGLQGTWLRNADFTNAQMASTQFGELPYLDNREGGFGCAFSPDEMTLSIGTRSGTINVYSTSTWERVKELIGHPSSAFSIAYSPTGDRLISGSSDKTVRLWDMEAGVCKFVLRGHTQFVKSVAYSPGGLQAASASEDQTVRLWDTETGECLSVLTDHTDNVYCVVYSPSGHQMATCSGDGTLRLWNPESMETSFVLKGHTDEVIHVVYSPRGERLASASRDGTVRLWESKTGDCSQILSSAGSFPFVAFSPKGDRLASTGPDQTVKLWDVESGESLHTLEGHTSDVMTIAYSSYGDLLVSAGDDETVRLWDTESGFSRQKFTGHSSAINMVVFTPNGDRAVSIGDFCGARVWDVGSESSRHFSNSHGAVVNDVKYSPRGGQIATCSDDRTIRLWSISTASLSCTHVLTGHQHRVNSIAYSPEGDYLVSCSSDKTLKLWNTNTGECLGTLAAHVRPINTVAWSPDGRQIASAGNDYAICLWDPEDKELRQVLGGHDEMVFMVVYSPQGNTMATSSNDCTIRLWDTATGECTHIIIGHTKRAYTLAFSPDGRHFMFTFESGPLRLWDVERGTSIQTLTGHKDEANRIAYSPRGDMLVSAADDETVRLWKVASGQCLSVNQDFQSRVKSVDWVETSDGNYVVTGCEDGTVVLWKVIVDGGQYQMCLAWRSTRAELFVNGAIIQDAQGLSRPNKALLRQRKAVGEPGNRFRDAAKKLTSLAFVISKLKAASSASGESLVASTNDLMGQVEQANEAQVQEIQGVSAALIQALRDRREEIRVILGFD